MSIGVSPAAPREGAPREGLRSATTKLAPLQTAYQVDGLSDTWADGERCGAASVVAACFGLRPERVIEAAQYVGELWAARGEAPRSAGLEQRVEQLSRCAIDDLARPERQTQGLQRFSEVLFHLHSSSGTGMLLSEVIDAAQSVGLKASSGASRDWPQLGEVLKSLSAGEAVVLGINGHWVLVGRTSTDTFLYDALGVNGEQEPCVRTLSNDDAHDVLEAYRLYRGTVYLQAGSE